MRLVRKLFGLFVVVTVSLITSVQINAQVYDYGSIPDSHYEMEIYDLDSSANAVVLFDYGESEVKYDRSDGFQLQYSRHQRLKVLQDAGTKVADVIIPFRHMRPEQKIENVRATSYTLLENGTVQEQSLKRDEIFIEKDTRSWSDLKFSIPGVKKGSIIEISYDMVMDFQFWYPDWHFQTDIPTIWSEYKTKIPEFYSFSYQTTGEHDLYIKNSSVYEDRARITFTVNNSSNRIGVSGMGQRVTETLDFKGEELHFVMKDVPALPDEPFIRSRNEYEAKVEFQIIGLQYPGQVGLSYARPWVELISDLLNDDDFGKKIRSNDDLKREVQYLTYGVESARSKMQIIYNDIINRVQWDGYYGVFLDQNTIDVFKKGRGSGSEINMTLLQMLKEAGMNAYPLIVSTHQNGEINTLLGVVDQFNHTLVYVDMGEEAFILDATDKYRPYTLLPENVLGTNGLLLYRDQVIWIPVNNSALNTTVSTVMLNISDAGFQGSLRTQTSGYYAVNIRKGYSKTDSVTFFQNFLFDDESFTKVSNVIGTLDDFENGFTYQLEFSNDETVSGDVMYFNPMIIGGITKNPFKIEDRFFPVDYNYPFQRVVTMNVSLPQGWIVEELPKPIMYRLPDNGAEFQRILQAGSGAIMMRYILKVNKPRFMPEEYEALRNMYEQLVQTLAENIVLKKAS